MANFWDSATRGFNVGVVLGERGAERAADREERDKYRAEQKERYDKQDVRAQEAHDVHMEEATEKQTHRKIKQGIGQMIGLMNVGEEDAAIKVAQDLYKTAYPNGQDVMVFNREWDPKNKLFENQDKDVKYLVVTGREGEKANPVPFKNANDIIKMFEPYLDYDKYSADMKELKKQRNAYNAAQESFAADDGKRYIKQMDDKGEVKTVPYEGVVKQSKLQQDTAETEKVLGRKLTPEEKRVKTGLSKPESPSERIAADAARRKATGEGGAGGTGNVDKKALDSAKAKLDILLKPFVSKGKPVLDPETGEMTEAADNALKSAGELIDKAKSDPDKMTKTERRNLPHAIRAWEVYKAYSAAITASVISPEQAAKMAEGEGTPTNYKDGEWHVVPSGKDQGKEARWNGKKYELRDAPEERTPPTDEPEPTGGPGEAQAATAPPVATTPEREPTAAQQNATRAGLVSSQIGTSREKSALDNLTTEDLAEAGRAALAAVTSPVRRVKEDYERQKNWKQYDRK